MTVAEQLHNSKVHREGFDQNCPRCLADEGIEGIIRHLESCAKQNEADAKAAARFERPLATASVDSAVAAEQRRMVGVLRLYRKVSPHGNPKSGNLTECPISSDSRTGK